MKESEQGRVCEAAPSARRGAAALKCVPPLEFRVPPAICCARAIRGGWGGGAPLYAAECAVGAPSAPPSALGTVCCRLGWDCPGRWGRRQEGPAPATGRVVQAKAGEGEGRRCTKVKIETWAWKRRRGTEGTG